MNKKAFTEADVLLTKKNGYYRFFAKSNKAIEIMSRWETRTRQNKTIYVAQIPDTDFIRFMTFLSVQGLLIHSDIALHAPAPTMPAITKTTDSTSQQNIG